MDRTQYTNLAKAWEFTEEHARELEPSTLADARTAADESGQLQGPAAQARFLGLLVRNRRGHRLLGGDSATRLCLGQQGTVDRRRFHRTGHHTDSQGVCRTAGRDRYHASCGECPGQCVSAQAQCQ